MPRALILYLILVLFGKNLLAQERKIIGRIMDLETNKPIKNANVIIWGTTSGTFSNQAGFFELSIDTLKHKSIIVSHIGYETSEITIPREDRFKFSLKNTRTELSKLNLTIYPVKPKNIVTTTTENASGFIVVESNAIFPGGLSNFYDFFGNELIRLIPSEVGDFSISFSIDLAGRPIGVHISDSSTIITNAVNQIFKNMPSWIPATQRQGNVVQHFILPIINRKIPNPDSPDFKKLYSFISNNCMYPVAARRTGVEGTVYAEFQINKFGIIQKIDLIIDIGAGCGDEIKRLISSIPSDILKSLYDQTFITEYILPLSFGLDKPYKGQLYINESSSFLLKPVTVTAVGVVRERRH